MGIALRSDLAMLLPGVARYLAQIEKLPVGVYSV